MPHGNKTLLPWNKTQQSAEQLTLLRFSALPSDFLRQRAEMLMRVQFPTRMQPFNPISLYDRMRPRNKTMTVATTSNRRPSIKVRLTIRPDDFGLLGLYLHLAQVSSELGRATVLRGVLSLGIVCRSPTELPANMNGLPAIAVRMTILARDAGFEMLHDELLILPTEFQRRIYLKDKITKIQIGANESKAEMGLQMIKFENPPSVDVPQVGSIDHDAHDTRSPDPQSDHLSKLPTRETSFKSTDLETQAPTSNLAFKRQMRDASRAFDIELQH